MSFKNSINLFMANANSFGSYPYADLTVDWNLFEYNTIPFYSYII
jgi:hypothetical protein